jgi:hypothetical protein
VPPTEGRQSSGDQVSTTSRSEAPSSSPARKSQVIVPPVSAVGLALTAVYCRGSGFERLVETPADLASEPSGASDDAQVLVAFASEPEEVASGEGAVASGDAWVPDATGRSGRKIRPIFRSVSICVHSPSLSRQKTTSMHERGLSGLSPRQRASARVGEEIGIGSVQIKRYNANVVLGSSTFSHSPRTKRRFRRPDRMKL